jgi:O-antigen biosynthesis protein
MIEPLVTVIIPTYNRADLLPRAIESVRAQTYTHWELFVVDDASTDTTPDVVGRIVDSRVHYVRHSENRGGSAARNTGLAQAQGDYIAFLDSDDEWLPTKLEKQIGRFAQLAPEVGLVYTGALIVRDNDVQKRQMPVYRGQLFRKLLLENVVIGGGSSPMIKRVVLRIVQSFDENLPARQDIDFWLRIARYYLIDYVDEVLVVMYMEDDLGRITANIEKFIQGRLLFLKKFERDMYDAGVLHIYLYRLGQQYQRLAEDRVTARQWYRKAIRIRPLALYGYGLYFLSFLPSFFYQMFDGIKRQFLYLSRK